MHSGKFLDLTESLLTCLRKSFGITACGFDSCSQSINFNLRSVALADYRSALALQTCNFAACAFNFHIRSFTFTARIIASLQKFIALVQELIARTLQLFSTMIRLFDLRIRNHFNNLLDWRDSHNWRGLHHNRHGFHHNLWSRANGKS